MSLTIEQINNLQAENAELRNKLLLAENQYNKVVEQNKELQKAVKDLEEMYGLHPNLIT